MSTKPAVQSMPREQAGSAYSEANERRYRNQVDEELLQKFDRRSNLVLGRGKSLVLTSASGGVAYSLSLSDAGILTVTDADGDVAEILLNFDAIGGELGAGRIDFGTQTEFDTATETFITEAGGVRTRYGAPFGASSDLLRWYGPTSIAQGSETRTNGYLAEGTDGVIRFGASPLGWGATAAQAAADNSYVPNGVNQLVDHAFRFGATYWRSLAQSGTVTPTEGTSAGVRFRALTGAGVTVGHYIRADSFPDRTRFTCEPGDNIEASAYLAQGGCSAASIFIQFFNSSGGSVGFSAGVASAVSSAVTSLADWTRLTDFGVAPAGTAYAMINISGIASTATPVLYVAKPMMAIANSGQTTPSAWSPGLDAEPGATATTPANDKAVTKTAVDLDIDTSGTTWIEGSTVQMTVGASGYLKVQFSSLSAAVTAAISAGTNFLGNWRITEATQAAPSTKTVVWSGTFTADSGGGSVEVTGYVSPLSQVLATYTGACQYILEVQRASGTNNVTNLTSSLSISWTPSG